MTSPRLFGCHVGFERARQLCCPSSRALWRKPSMQTAQAHLSDSLLQLRQFGILYGWTGRLQPRSCMLSLCAFLSLSFFQQFFHGGSFCLGIFDCRGRWSPLNAIGCSYGSYPWQPLFRCNAVKDNSTHWRAQNIGHCRAHPFDYLNEWCLGKVMRSCYSRH